MNKISILLFLTNLCFNVLSQESRLEIPGPVIDKFKTLHLNYENEKWERVKGFNYLVTYTVDSQENRMILDEFGNILRKEIIIPLLTLPKKILQFVNSEYPSFEIKEVSKIDSDLNDLYFVQIFDNKSELLKLIFDMEGNYIKTLTE